MEELADRLASVATELVVRVRDDDPAAVHRWLASQVAGLNEWIGLAAILAAAVPDDRPWTQLVAWITDPPADRRRRTWRESKRRSRLRDTPVSTGDVTKVVVVRGQAARPNDSAA